MGYCFTVFFDDIEAAKRMLAEREQVSAEEAGALISKLMEVCRAGSQPVGSLDHFVYEEEDFPELWDFQYGESSTPFALPITDEGIPSVGHWPAEDIPKLLEQVRSINLEDRPSYLKDEIMVGPEHFSSPVKELERWLSEAQARNAGLIHFYG